MTPAFTHLATVGSTNDWLLTRAETLPDGHWVIADRQTAGRGRRGRVWNDGAGNLMASVLVRSGGPVQQLSFVAALALHGAITNFLPREGEERLVLKWPNDVLLDGVKVSGILLERAGDALVIGFGVNIASHPEGTERPATSLTAAGLDAPEPLTLLAPLMDYFAHWRGVWAARGFARVRTAWLAQASGLGGRILARLGQEDVPGLFDGLDDDGALRLRLDDGSVRAIHAGEVFAL
ncbi:MAG: biotin--[acetyl-CoA-carboxylase] ligase [Alphaproteobacteria bacterium PA4]|nr:MAG: biotin--[acetyl-CoA-carboxylase] ligase [Alphaproteobacteria bacterium PA4]